LRFGVELLNLKNGLKRLSDIRVQTRVFHDRKMVFESKQSSLNAATAVGAGGIVHNDAIELGENLLTGDYVMQIVVTDQSSSKKKDLATQYVQFEVVP
jgi:hypothetical protein